MNIIYRSPQSEKEFEEYFTFRWEYLRKPLGLPQGSEQDAFENNANHIAAFHNEAIIGVGRLQLEDPLNCRIRYMAVASSFRKQGVGSKMLYELENIAHSKNITTCWLLAREAVVPFYLKNNYELNGVAKSELDIPHKRMQKTFNP